VAALVFLFVGGGEVDLMTTRVILVAAAVVGMVAGALLSSTSHIVELLVIIHRNQLRRENHLGQKLQKLQQALHE
jgi:siroheme synthase (precorrin-2 oxidase/ferrochelatase)